MTAEGAGEVRLEIIGRLDAAELAAVSALVEAATEADGVRPLSEHVMLHLRYGGDQAARNVLLYQDGELAAYAHLDVTDVVAGASAEVVVHPEHRRHGLGRTLVEATVAETPDGRLRLWSHGEHPGAAALAHSLGFERSRALWQMRRSLFAPLATPVLPPGVTVRTFRPGADDEAWVALNALAFRGHPEQGQWSIEDLHLRMQEPWFDAAGFFLAERDGRLVGFHWTKVHGGGQRHHERPEHGHAPIGEVYVLGVDPAEQGTGLGKALTLAGLRHLRQRGLHEAMLFVEADNQAAIRLYSGLGFTRWETDVMFSRDSRVVQLG
ncbi:MAG: mycothiol synthase [Actinomycetota bacterium]|nr:mycothiol synthase [Actinomycetota bacterium]